MPRDMRPGFPNYGIRELREDRCEEDARSTATWEAITLVEACFLGIGSWVMEG